MNKEKEVYILHQYDEKSHFKALYDNDIKIKDYIILSKKSIIKKFINDLKNKESISKSINHLFKNMYKLIKIKKIKGEVLIVGLAPYDYILNKYEKLFAKNKCIYFTSWQFWDGSNYARGNIKNKENFERILKENFVSAACVSKKTQEEVSFIFDKSIVVNHSIDVEKYKKKSIYKYNKKLNFIFVGQFIERKNIDLMLKWIKDSKKKDFTFSFAGSGKLEEKIKSAAKNDSRIIYLGRLSKKQLQNELCKYDYLILPSKEEPFGIVLMEALAAGIPAVTSNCYGPLEIIKNNETGFIFNKNIEKEFYEVINNCFDIKEKDYYEMSCKCKKEAERYSTNSIFAIWREMIESIN